MPPQKAGPFVIKTHRKPSLTTHKKTHAKAWVFSLQLAEYSEPINVRGSQRLNKCKRLIVFSTWSVLSRITSFNIMSELWQHSNKNANVLLKYFSYTFTNEHQDPRKPNACSNNRKTNIYDPSGFALSHQAAHLMCLIIQAIHDDFLGLNQSSTTSTLLQTAKATVKKSEPSGSL